MNAPFPIQPELTAIAIGYRNTRMIADGVLPRTPVGKQEFKYLKHTKEEGFTLPDTKVARKSAPNRVEFTASEVESSTQDHALDDSIPIADIENRPPNFDPEGHATMQLANLIELDREVRTANLVFALASYPAANRTTLSGTSQWSDYTNSNPLSAIMSNLDTCIMRPNIGVLGRAVFTILRQHPKIVEAVKATGAGGTNAAGMVSRQQIQELFELEELLVGESWVNTAKKGQAASYSRVWGKHALFLYRDQLATVNSGTTFGFTAQWGDRIAGSFEDKDVGMRGGKRLRVGESVKELISASDLAFFFENAVA